jgi:hypothetical protein
LLIEVSTSSQYNDLRYLSEKLITQKQKELETQKEDSAPATDAQKILEEIEKERVSFVSYSTAVPREQLEEIDMLPRIKDKLFLTPELAPTFAAKDDDLIQVLGIMTRILDGHGYESDTGAHGHRGYNERMMFVWIGAAVEIPRKVHKHLTTLGPKLYFLRLSSFNKSEDDYYKQLGDDFEAKIKEIRDALFEYLKYFEIRPYAAVENGLLLLLLLRLCYCIMEWQWSAHLPACRSHSLRTRK